MTTTVKTGMMAAEDWGNPHQSNPTAQVKHKVCHERNQMPARTGPIFAINLGAAKVEAISETVEMVRRRPTVVDVILGSGIANKKVVIWPENDKTVR